MYRFRFINYSNSSEVKFRLKDRIDWIRISNHINLMNNLIFDGDETYEFQMIKQSYGVTETSYGAVAHFTPTTYPIESRRVDV